jgi:hypothetical protein
MAVVIAFGWIFALPIIFVIAAQRDPRSLPLLHRIELVVSRTLLYPALVGILGAGIFLASDGHHWSEFFVQWGLGVVVVIGAVVGAVMIPASTRAEEAAKRDLEGYAGGGFKPGQDYQAITRRLTVVGSALSLLVLVTIIFMVVKP